MLGLVERFDRHKDTYTRDAYNEAQVRREFIDPFFAALGWDVHNTAGYAEAYKEVIHEDSIKVGGETKAPDYCFRIGGTRKFFVEAKKPSVDVKEDVAPAYQLRRYAWTNKLPLSIVTDFQEWAVYDCRVKPAPTDKSSTARTQYLTYTDYAARWGDIASIFSKDAILTGSFDRYAESNKRKRGTAEVDKEFLKEIEQWRDALARNIALRNENLSVRELNFAVGRTIDRIVFLRMCEDRGIETYAQRRGLVNGKSIYRRMVDLYHRADERYNSGLFHFQRERGRPGDPDELTPALDIDDKVLKEIIKSLYYPESPYEFSVLPADILGQVYEQFLGKVIRLTGGHRAVIEEKPEVKKAGGVYYTPTYIVDYIVEQTVGKLLDERGPGVRGQGSGGAGDGGATRGGEELSRSSGLAEGHGLGRTDLPIDADASHRRAIRPDEPDSASGGVGSGEHRGGPRSDSSGGLSSSSLHGEGLADGGRDASDAGGSSESGGPRKRGAGLGPGAAGRQTAQRAHRRTQKKVLKPGARPLPPGALRVLDPACGSGSFLLGAYQRLLRWYLDYYIANDPESWARMKNPPICQATGIGDQGAAAGGRGPGTRDQGPSWRLTIAERKRILLAHVFGVDIDPQAVEVTKLSLLLKVLEGESQQSLDNQLRLFHERALPDLADNIKCGNSLIGPDFYDNQQMTLLDDEERIRINAFDWHAEFPEIMGPRPDPQRGFDAVIGNPPYIRMEAFKELKAYLRERYSVHDERTDLYVYFIQREHGLLRTGGRFGMIVSNKFLRANYGRKTRELLSKTATISRIVDFAGLSVFHGATVRTLVLLTSKGSGHTGALYSPPPGEEDFRAIASGTKTVSEVSDAIAYRIPAESLSAEGWRLNRLEHARILIHLNEGSTRLVDYMEGRICRGIVSGLTDAFVMDGNTRRAILDQNPLAEEIIRPFLQGRDIRRYRIEYSDEFLAYTFHGIDISQYPAVVEHLRPFRERLEKRATRQEWYELQQPQFAYKALLEQPKIVFPDIATTCRFALDQGAHFAANTVYFLPTDDHNLLGLLNSRLGQFYFIQTCAALEGPGASYLRFFGQYLEEFPVRMTEHAARAGIVDQVERAIRLQEEVAATKTPTGRTALQRQIKATDAAIDRLVYELYGLTDSEIAIVEAATVPSGRDRAGER